MAALIYQMDTDAIVRMLKREFQFNAATEMHSVVLVGGKGTRLDDRRKIIQIEDYPEMHPQFHGEIGPKGMAMLRCQTPSGLIRQPLTDWHLDIHARTEQIKSITLGLGCRADILLNYYEGVQHSRYRNIPLKYLVEANPAGTLAPIIKMLELHQLPHSPIVFANGDNLMDIDFYRAYLIGCYFALRQGQRPADIVIDIIALVPWEESAAYGTVDYDFDTGIAHKFREKAPVALNPHRRINDREITPINSGFSIIPDPASLFPVTISSEVIAVCKQLEAGELSYPGHERIVKYETLYERLAEAKRLFGVYFDQYWTDLGTEEKIIAAERDFSGTRVVQKLYS